IFDSCQISRISYHRQIPDHTALITGLPWELLLEKLVFCQCFPSTDLTPCWSGQDGPASTSRAPKAAPDGTRSVPSLLPSASMPAWASASTAASGSATSTVTSNGPSPSPSSARRTGPSPLGARRSMVKPRISKVASSAASPGLLLLHRGSASNKAEYRLTAS